MLGLICEDAPHVFVLYSISSLLDLVAVPTHVEMIDIHLK